MPACQRRSVASLLDSEAHSPRGGAVCGAHLAAPQPQPLRRWRHSLPSASTGRRRFTSSGSPCRACVTVAISLVSSPRKMGLHRRAGPNNDSCPPATAPPARLGFRTGERGSGLVLCECNSGAAELGWRRRAGAQWAVAGDFFFCFNPCFSKNFTD